MAEISSNTVVWAAILSVCLWVFAANRIVRNERRRQMRGALLLCAAVMVMLNLVVAMAFTTILSRDALQVSVGFVVGLSIVAALVVAVVVKSSRAKAPPRIGGK